VKLRTTVLIVFIAVLSFGIKIGLVLPMTGELSRGGKDAWKGIQIAHEEKPSVLGKRIELILVDNKSGATETAQAFSQLINTQKVIAIIGALGSNNTLAGALIAEKNKIPVITLSLIHI
jgi:branched-chain amino acid transport system substrate-binding protein